MGSWRDEPDADDDGDDDAAPGPAPAAAATADVDWYWVSVLRGTAVAISWLHFPVVDFSIKLTLIYLRSLKLLSMAATATAVPPAPGGLLRLPCLPCLPALFLFLNYGAFLILAPRFGFSEGREGSQAGQTMRPEASASHYASCIWISTETASANAYRSVAQTLSAISIKRRPFNEF